MVWRKSLDTGQIPQALKTANVIPGYKGGYRGTPKNYTPVALTSHLIKVFEKIGKKVIVYLETSSTYHNTAAVPVAHA